MAKKSSVEDDSDVFDDIEISDNSEVIENITSAKHNSEEIIKDIHNFTDEPGNCSWTGWSVWYLGRRARHNDAEWSFHTKEL